MRPSQLNGILPLSLLGILGLAGLSSAVTIDCKSVVVDKHRYDLSPLKGPHATHWVRQDGIPLKNFTFTIDLCAPLKKIEAEKNECPLGTRVCGQDYAYYDDGEPKLDKVVTIAGNYVLDNHGSLDPHWTRFKNSDSNADFDKDGLRLELNGGKFPFQKGGRKQKAIVEFHCDPDKTGLEGDENGGFEDAPPGDDKEPTSRRSVDISEDEPKDPLETHEGHSLQFISYGPAGKDEEIDVLRLKWTTKYACENAIGDNRPVEEHWGFFTWLIVILFLVIAAYLIFGSWLNYNRYGARGWDLLPHGDTIRDVPYHMKDFARRAVGVFQSPASRGGYSAV